MLQQIPHGTGLPGVAQRTRKGLTQWATSGAHSLCFKNTLIYRRENRETEREGGMDRTGESDTSSVLKLWSTEDKLWVSCLVNFKKAISDLKNLEFYF